jgi:hypothetical protein|eukprot:SAG25_NODE_535_length_7114_cov_2.609408_12_plen_83_part_00
MRCASNLVSTILAGCTIALRKIFCFGKHNHLVLIVWLVHPPCTKQLLLGIKYNCSAHSRNTIGRGHGITIGSEMSGGVSNVT